MSETPNISDHQRYLLAAEVAKRYFPAGAKDMTLWLDDEPGDCYNEYSGFAKEWGLEIADDARLYVQLHEAVKARRREGPGLLSRGALRLGIFVAEGVLGTYKAFLNHYGDGSGK
ncbi:MAG TPA: hypothetical protein VLG27_04355 [Candidatus Saccharimonadia bacterium]|nr:hypothetical protein [Candidatus Saccharimonadia bacterium]